MSDEKPKRIGRPRKGAERRVRAWFSVSAKDMEWLDTLPNRSAWLAEQITKAQEEQRDE